MTAATRLAKAVAQEAAARAAVIAAVRDARTAGWSLREIAVVLECSPETVRKLAA